MSTTSKRLYLIDGSGFIFRAFHALPPLTRADGVHINAVMGFCNMLYKICEETNDAHYFAVIFDSARRNFRHDIYPNYKAHRPELPPELVPQFGLIREACQAFTIFACEKEGFEADDLIATYTHQARAQGIAVTIVSSDKDLMQLVNDQTIMMDPLRNRIIGIDQVFEKFGVLPERVTDVQALAGDTSDGVPGVPGIGIKTAADLITTYGDLKNLLNHLDQIKQTKRRQTLENHVEHARLSHQLVTLDHRVPDLPTLQCLEKQPIDIIKIKNFLQEQGFRSLLARVEKKYGITSPQVVDGNDNEILKRNDTTPLDQSMQTCSYVMVNTAEDLNLWIEKIQKAGRVAIDTETTSLIIPDAKLVGISLSTQSFEACYIPLQHKVKQAHLFQSNEHSETQLDLTYVLETLRSILMDPSILKIGHNLKYDMAILAKYDVDIYPCADTMILSYSLDGTSVEHSLDALSLKHLKYQMTSYAQITGTGRQKITFDEVDLKTATNYASEDADITLRLYHFLNQRLITERMQTLYHNLDQPLLTVLQKMEKTGVYVDSGILTQLSLEFVERLKLLEHEIYDLAGTRFNIASPKQLADILFQNMKLKGQKKGKAGSFSTGIAVLEDLAEQGIPIAKKIIAWRQLAKLKSTYTDALIDQIHPVTQRIHTSYSMTVTSTGRLSSRDPNLQNIPIRTEEGRKIRQAFIAKPGHHLISMDYSQIELRLLAHMADIDVLKRAFCQNLDIHTMTAADVFNMAIDQVDSEHRRRAKAINFGIIYGISAFGLAQQLKIDRSTASAYIQDYYQRYPGIVTFMEQSKNYARNHGYVQTLSGRKCFMIGIHDKNASQRGFAERQAINAPLQGTAADIIRKAMIDVARMLDQQQLSSQLILQVHDELVFEVPFCETEILIQSARQVMENVIKLSVPLTVDIGIGHNWDEAH